MLTSLIQSTPPQVRTARSPHARPDLARSDRTDGQRCKTRASHSPLPTKLQPRLPRFLRKVADQPETILNTMPRGKGSFARSCRIVSKPSVTATEPTPTLLGLRTKALNPDSVGRLPQRDC